jgi:hypothetical protein
VPHYAQLAHFPKGVSHLKQLTCGSWKAVLKIILPVMINLFADKPQVQKKVEQVVLHFLFVSFPLSLDLNCRSAFASTWSTTLCCGCPYTLKPRSGRWRTPRLRTFIPFITVANAYE